MSSFSFFSLIRARIGEKGISEEGETPMLQPPPALQYLSRHRRAYVQRRRRGRKKGRQKWGGGRGGIAFSFHPFLFYDKRHMYEEEKKKKRARGGRRYRD